MDIPGERGEVAVNKLKPNLKSIQTYPAVVEGLKSIYDDTIKPVEEKYLFDKIWSPSMRDSDFKANPMLLLIGQYSTGKTSFVEFLLDRQYPGEMVGPEPTTDRFVAIMHGDSDRVIPGNALSVNSEMPFHALGKFGSSFLSKFEASQCNSDILKHLTIIDTPGILSGEKQRVGRNYDFVGVVEWFASRSDLILLLFDAHKLDISDEFKRVIEILKGYDDKIRVVLNKADAVNSQQLMRVYGSMMWSLGKVVKTPEVMRVYISSFWNRPFKNTFLAEIFQAEQNDLLKDLYGLPRNSAMRKVSDLVKRARHVKVHALVISHLKSKMPKIGRLEKKKEQLIMGLTEELVELQRKFSIPSEDFQSVKRLKEYLGDYDFSKFPKLNEKMIMNIEEALAERLPQLMQMLSKTEIMSENPFAEQTEEDPWVLTSDMRDEYTKKFEVLFPQDGFLSGKSVRETMMEYGHQQSVLHQIWKLSDMDKDGKLDLDEFVIAIHLCETVKRFPKKVIPLPNLLPEQLVPEHKRGFYH